MKLVLAHTVLLVLLLCSCKKEQSIVIQANDLGTGQGTAYAGMTFSVIQSKPAWNEDKITTIYEGVLDENGHASFDVKMNKDWTYVLSVSQPDGICYGDALIHYLDNQNSNLVTIKYAKCAKLKFILNNVSCFDSNDAISYTRTWLTNNEIQGTNTYVGCDFFEGGFFELPAGEYKYDWEVTKSGNTTFHSENFTLVAGDSLVFQIDY